MNTVENPTLLEPVRKGLPILFVEDNEDDAFFMQKAFNRSACANTTVHLSSGKEVVDYLTKAANGSDKTRFSFPSIIFLDLKMEGMNGFDALKWIRGNADQRIKLLVVIVLSSSNQPVDMRMATQLGANAYHVKPTDFESLVSLLRSACEFWLKVNQPPL